MAFNFDCPHCGRAQTVTTSNESEGSIHFYMSESSMGHIGLWGAAICCANSSCMKPTVLVHVKRAATGGSGRYFVKEEPILTVRLIPESSAKPQPEFIPEPLREDYLEACRIRDLSPKASATLSRRCLQGMIRDFCGVKKGTLFDEINALRELVNNEKAPVGVSLDSVDAIDQVRGVGNIGAHMEKDINHIVPVDPEEAQLLIDLIESLFEDWYIAREKRASRFSGIKALADSKKKLISDLKVAVIEGPKD